MRVSKSDVKNAVKTLHAAGFIRWENDGNALRGKAEFHLNARDNAVNLSATNAEPLALSGRDSTTHVAADGDRMLTKIFREHVTKANAAAAGK